MLKNHNLKILIIFLSFLCLLVSYSDSFASAEKLSFIVTFDKSEYKVDEPVNMTLKLVNNSPTPVYVNKRFYINTQDSAKKDREVYLIITNEKGQKMPCFFSYETGLPKSDYFVLLEPEKDAASEWSRDLRGYFDLKEPGAYTVVAVYENTYGQELGLDAFKGKITSEPVIFKIVKSEVKQ